MDDHAPATPGADGESPAPHARRTALLRRAAPLACLLAAAFGATQFFAARFLFASVQTLRIRLPVSIAILIALALCLIVAGAVVAFVTRWRLPLRRLTRTIDEIRAGQRPIEDLRLPDHAGGLSPLLPPLHDLFRQLREQKAQIASLELEMSQRVARRTHALERSLSGLRAQATRDALTGLYNRRMLDQCLDEVVSRCHAERESLCVMMIDLDDFKLLNDTLGHAKGDELLRAVGQLIRSSVGPQDLAFRCGGDEFVILCPRATKPRTEALGRRLIELVDALAKPLNVARKPRLCIGLSLIDDAAGQPTGQALLAEADRRLYAAKAMRKRHCTNHGRAA